MGVINATEMRVKSGRWDDFLENTRKAEAILTQYGAKNVRLLARISGGDDVAVVLIWEADDFKVHGEVMDAVLHHGGTDLMRAQRAAADAPLESMSNSLFSDIPMA